jgi:hypothetical protein
MRAKAWLVGPALIVSALCSSCERNKDSEVRRWIRDSLAVYLDSLAFQVCELKYAKAPEIPGQLICPGPPEGHAPPPKNGNP